MTTKHEIELYEAMERNAEYSLAIHAESIARDCAVLAKRGNGEGGYILSVVRDALMRAELIFPMAREKQSKKKQLAPGLRKKVFERDAYRCVKCGSHIDLEVDHIHPESLGGEAVMSNLQTLCKVCNGKKGNRVQESNHG